MAVNGTNILITFNMLMDTDLGLLYLVKEKYNDPSVFDNDVLDLDDKLLKGLLQENSSRNPLMVIMKDKNEIQANVFYDELLMTEYENITKKALPTTMIDVVKRLIDSDSGFKIDILCATKLEASIISNMMGEYRPSTYKLLIQSERVDVDLSTYDTIFINYVEELLDFNNITGKNLMISDYRCNMNPQKYEEKKKIPKDEYVVLFGGSNEFYTVSIYYYDESYYLN